MGLPKEPLKTIFPIVSLRKEPKRGYLFLGTGFFISNDGTFLTAKHVFENPNIDDRSTYNAVMLHDGPTVHKISGVEFSQHFDIALGHVEEVVQDIQPLKLATENAPMNYDILTAEFSGTMSKQLENGSSALHFTPYFRKGYVICYYESDFPEHVLTQSLDISFPALMGASGAPVIVERTGSVIGMIVANVERHLLPAQVIRVQHDQTPEEVRYFLPIGKAIGWKHLVEFVDSVRQTE